MALGRYCQTAPGQIPSCCLSLPEVQLLVHSARQLRYRVFIVVTYTLGLRLSEALNLQLRDIDADNHRVHVRRGKGAKDRFVPLPEYTLAVMRKFWAHHRNPTWLFPRATHLDQLHTTNLPMSYSATQVAVRQIVCDTGIKKSLYPHSAPQLCHSYASTWHLFAQASGYSRPFLPQNHCSLHPSNRGL